MKAFTANSAVAVGRFGLMTKAFKELFSRMASTYGDCEGAL